MEICRSNNNNHAGVTEAPEYLKVARESILEYLFNALFFNVNYKDLAQSNLEHMTNLFMNPMPEMTTTPRVYPFYEKMFRNTAITTRGYLTHCFSVVIDAGVRDHPFVTRRDFDLLLLHKVLTGELKLSLALCRSYLFKGSYNPLSEVRKCFLMTIQMHEGISRPLSETTWTTMDGGFVMQSTAHHLTKRVLKMGLTYCADHVIHWTPAKISAIIRFAETTDLRVRSTKVRSSALFTVTKGVFLIGKSQGLIISTRDCHPYVFAWTPAGLHRFDDITEYLWSKLGRDVKSTVRQLNKPHVG